MTPEEWNRLFLGLHNETRGHAGPLVWSRELEAMAAAHAQKMVQMRYPFHDMVPEGGGQNVAVGRLNFARKPEAVLRRWMEDPPHARVVVDQKWHEVGAAYGIDPATNDVYVVADYR